MNLIIKFCIITIILFKPAISSQNNGIEQIVVPLSEPQEKCLLILNHNKGSITLEGYNGAVVILDAQLRYPGYSRMNEQNDGLKQIETHSVQLSATEKNNTIEVYTNSDQHTIDLDIKVPQKCSLKISTQDNGNIVVRNLTGEMELSNANGDIVMTQVSGSAVLNTIDGDIMVKFDKITPEAPMAFSSIEGKIDITFPADLRALVKMRSDHGEVYSDFNMQMQERQTVVEKQTKSGIFKVFLDEWTIGKINGGGPEILLKSFHGNIYIRARN